MVLGLNDLDDSQIVYSVLSFSLIALLFFIHLRRRNVHNLNWITWIIHIERK